MPKHVLPYEPTSPNPGEDWLNTANQEWSIYTGSTWTLIGPITDDPAGIASRLGTHLRGGLAAFSQGVSKSDPNTTEGLTRDGQSIVTTNDLATAKTEVLAAIDAKIAGNISGTGSPFDARSKVAVLAGISDDTKEEEIFTIPLPYYQDGLGTQASAADCSWNMVFSYLTWDGSTTTYPAGFYETSTRKYINSSSSSDDPPALITKGAYFIIAVR